MSVYLDLQTGASGTPLEAIEASLGASRRIGIMIRININGVTLLIAPDDDADKLHTAWQYAIDRGRSFASALT